MLLEFLLLVLVLLEFLLLGLVLLDDVLAARLLLPLPLPLLDAMLPDEEAILLEASPESEDAGLLLDMDIDPDDDSVVFAPHDVNEPKENKNKTSIIAIVFRIIFLPPF